METIKRMLKYHDMIANMLNIFIKDKPIIYFIDYDNVHFHCFDEYLFSNEKNHFLVFYTIFSKRATERADYLKVHSKNVDLIKVPKGKEVGDRVIISHIGYYINKYNKKYRYCILSKDRGYDSVVNFWSNKGFDIYLNKTTDFAVNYMMKHMSNFNSNLSDKVLKDRTRNPQLVNKAIEDRLKNENVDVRSNIKKILINTKDKMTVANQLNIIYGETKGNYYYNRILDFISIRQAKKYRKKTLESACKT